MHCFLSCVVFFFLSKMSYPYPPWSMLSIIKSSDDFGFLLTLTRQSFSFPSHLSHDMILLSYTPYKDCTVDLYYPEEILRSILTLPPLVIIIFMHVCLLFPTTYSHKIKARVVNERSDLHQNQAISLLGKVKRWFNHSAIVYCIHSIYWLIVCVCANLSI